MKLQIDGSDKPGTIIFIFRVRDWERGWRWASAAALCFGCVGASRASFDAEGAAAFDALRGHRGLWMMGAFGKGTQIRTWTVRKGDA